jgi:glycosyltransferase involved in cell wall biosynthesis
MRIAIMGIRGLPSTYSGYETFADAVGPRLVERGHEVSVYCRAALFPQRTPFYRGMQLIYTSSLETKELSTLSHTWMCMADVARRQTDVILVCNVANGLHLVAPRLLGRTAAINVDGLEWRRPKWNRLGRAYFRFAAHVACRLANCVVCDAEAMAAIYRREFSARPVTIAYGAEITTSPRPDILATYDLEAGRYLLVLGRLIPDNNADLVVRAYASVRTEMPLVIVGDANYKSAFVAALHAQAGGNVRFLGHVDNREHVQALFNGAYAYIHGHEFGGTNPSLLAALGSATCVLALDTPFSREVLAGDYGLFFDKSERALSTALQAVLDEPALRQRYADRAPQRIAEAYTWDHITDQYEATFTRLLNGTAS